MPSVPSPQTPATNVMPKVAAWTTRTSPRPTDPTERRNRARRLEGRRFRGPGRNPRRTTANARTVIAVIVTCQPTSPSRNGAFIPGRIDGPISIAGSRSGTNGTRITRYPRPGNGVTPVGYGLAILATELAPARIPARTNGRASVGSARIRAVAATRIDTNPSPSLESDAVDSSPATLAPLPSVAATLSSVASVRRCRRRPRYAPSSPYSTSVVPRTIRSPETTAGVSPARSVSPRRRSRPPR